MTGSFREASDMTGIPERTIRSWAEMPWWDTVLDEAKNLKDTELDSLWTQILHVVGEQLKDRLTNGDYKFHAASGKIVRVPVPANQLAIVAGIATDKRSDIRNRGRLKKGEVAVDPTAKTKTLEELSRDLMMEESEG